MKVWHFSDTHSYHEMVNIPNDIDIAIFSGDCSNPRDKYQNEQEVLNFLCWFGMVVKAKHKIMIAGNHDTSVEAKFIRKEKFKEHGIIYLENESIEIDTNSDWSSLSNHEAIGSTVVPINKIKIWGSPYTPSFGDGWSFNKKRDKLHDLWKNIPGDTDIVVTHGPPKGILDLSYSRENKLEFCGCNALSKVIRQIQPKLHLFGHIHNCEDIINAGYTKLSDYKTIFSNGSVVTDGKFGKVSSHGNIFEI